MTALFLIVWFYIYAGLLFGLASNATCLFPNIGGFWQVIGWPVLSGIYLYKRIARKY